MSIIREVSKIYRSSLTCKLDRLLKLERQWRRRATIAQNKLAKVRRDITKLALEATAGK